MVGSRLWANASGVAGFGRELRRELRAQKWDRGSMRVQAGARTVEAWSGESRGVGASLGTNGE